MEKTEYLMCMFLHECLYTVGCFCADTSEYRNPLLVFLVAIRAGVPVDVKVRAINFLSLPSNSLDAVVSTYCLSNLKEEEIKVALREAVRLLKPGKPLIFVENVKANGEFVASCQILFQKAIRFFGVQSVPPKEIAKVLEEVQGLEKLSYETVFDYQDPHIVGIAVKQMETTESRSKKRGNKKTASV
ncbi:hypothetical protein KP509_24G007200 [Ceratopteris richardii]|uniref:Methyltransferase type 11 domain-containing protein n=1 Tax=Ceratopteris richardii TaxID=49495 RepID=A0A8T2RUC8_CERRI|nr:hypothetical protein KP509_24G007200 [Ceratopteris richardii]